MVCSPFPVMGGLWHCYNHISFLIGADADVLQMPRSCEVKAIPRPRDVLQDERRIKHPINTRWTCGGFHQWGYQKIGWWIWELGVPPFQEASMCENVWKSMGSHGIPVVTANDAKKLYSLTCGFVELLLDMILEGKIDWNPNVCVCTRKSLVFR